MTESTGAKGISVVGVGAPGRAVIRVLREVSPPSIGYVVVARGQEDLTGFAGAATALVRSGNPPEDLRALRRALGGADLVVVAGWTDDGATAPIVGVPTVTSGANLLE